jgi:hypothetical protein
MRVARVAILGRAMPAEEYEVLAPERRRDYAESLTCPGCGQLAYFIRRARNGRAACFGARPHLDGCELASPESATVEPPATAEDEFVLKPVTFPGPRPDEATGVATTSAGERGPSAPRKDASGSGSAAAGMALGSLLRRLVRDPEFSRSEATLVLPDATRGPVRTVCVQAIAADARWQNRRKLYWGTVRYAHDDGAGGAWLNLGRRGSATLRLAPDTLTALLESHDADDLEQLQGASFVGYLPLRKSTTSDRLFLFVADLEWFALRMPDEDPI